MNKYTIQFRGRTRNAIGIFYTIVDSVIAENKEQAELKLYDKYEHIIQVKILKIEKVENENL